MKKSFIAIIFILIFTSANLFGNTTSSKDEFAELYSSFIENPTRENAGLLNKYIDSELEKQYYTAQTKNSKEMRSILLQINRCLNSDFDLQTISSLGIKFFSLQSKINLKSEYFYNELVICVLIILILMAMLFVLYTQTKFRLKKKIWLEEKTIEVQEDERREISIELHDTVCQILRSVSLKMEEGNLKQLILDSINLLRQICYRLTPPDIANNDLASAIIFYTQNYSKKNNVVCEAIFDDEKTKEKLNSFNSKDQLNIFRIIQEALTNSEKHAGKDYNSCVLCNMNEGNLNIFVTDNGLGFNTKEKTRSLSFGLQSLKQRAGFLNAKIQVTSEPNSGTTVHLWW